MTTSPSLREEFEKRFIAKDPDSGLPVYTQHPDVLLKWVAEREALARAEEREQIAEDAKKLEGIEIGNRDGTKTVLVDKASVLALLTQTSNTDLAAVLGNPECIHCGLLYSTVEGTGKSCLAGRFHDFKSIDL